MKNSSNISGEIMRLIEVMRKLRGPGGCPWDREQDHQSLRPYLLEETYEVLEAIDGNDPVKLKEELGDLLLQIVFHAQIAEESNQFDLGTIASELVAKLERRHPHVFQGVEVDGVKGVLVNWDKIKAAEKSKPDESILDGIPKSLPALQYAEKIQYKAAKIGFEWEDIRGAWEKLDEELAELKALIDGGRVTEMHRLEEETGDLLFAVVNVARYLKVHPEQALRKTISKFARRFYFMEKQAATERKNLAEMDLKELDELWEKAKAAE